jgi:outer membrane protein
LFQNLAVFLHGASLYKISLKQYQHMKHNILKIIIIMLLPIFSYAQQATNNVYRLTLEDCLDFAFRNSYNRQSMKLSEEAKESSYHYSRHERIPSVSASLSESFNNSNSSTSSSPSGSSWDGSLGLSANWLITQGGSINNNIKQSKLQMEQASYQTSQYDNELTIQILQAFLTALGNEELLKVQETLLIASQEQLEQGEIKYNVGQILESDYLMLQAQYATDKNNIVDTRISRDNSLMTLKILLSLDPLAELEIVYPDTSAMETMAILPSAQDVLDQALNTLPDLKISEYNIEIAKIGVKLSQSSYYPSLSMGASIGTGHTNFTNFGTQLSDRFNQQVGLSLSVPIYDKSKTKASVVQSKIALQQAELDQKQTELSVRQTVIQEYQNVTSAYSKYEASAIKENAYFKTFEAYRVQFDAGAITAVDLLQQQNNYISALNDYIQSKYGFMLKRKVLDIYMGVPVTM